MGKNRNATCRGPNAGLWNKAKNNIASGLSVGRCDDGVSSVWMVEWAGWCGVVRGNLSAGHGHTTATAARPVIDTLTSQQQQQQQPAHWQYGPFVHATNINHVLLNEEIVFG